jgi:NAD+ synthetase
LAVFPELALCGYPPRDLLLQQGFVERCEHVARDLQDSVPSIATVVGLPVRLPSGGIANALRVRLPSGESIVYRKRLLPTYDVFDEDRYFEPGIAPCVVDLGGTKVGLAICEDLWGGRDAGFAARYAGAADPVADLVSLGASMIVSPSASPFVLGKHHKHREIVRGHAVRHGITVASVNQLGANDELIFDGHAFAYGPDGSLLADAAPFHDQGPVVVGDRPWAAAGGGARAPEADLFAALCLGVRDYFLKTGFRGALLGLSGGIDSALTLVVAHVALQDIPGSRGVTGVAMPSRYSSGHSVEDALESARRLGVACHVAPIEAGFEGSRTMVDGLFAATGEPRLGERLPDLAEENLQSRIRGTLLMTLSNRTGSLVLTTGNKSELAVGYCTLYGDMNGGLAVLADVTKTWVYRLSRWINASFASIGLSEPPIPQRSIDKAPSAELRPGQTDQDSLPPYDLLDAIVERYVEQRMEPEAIVASGFDEPTVRRVVRLIDLSEHKRRQAAIALKVTSVAFGTGRRFPVAWRR